MSNTYVGIDVHKKLCVYTELDPSGNVLRRGKFGNNISEVSDFASRIGSGTHIVVEPVLNYEWLLDQIEPYSKSVHVAAPYKVRIIAESKSKTDKYDSRVLADLLRTNYLPESWLPPRDLRSLRMIIRQRYHFVKMLVSLKNRVRHLLFLYGADLKASDVSSASARREISRLLLPDVSLMSVYQCLEEIDRLKETIGGLNEYLEAASEGIEAVSLLRTIHGMGLIWSITIYAEVGDISRFRSAKAFSSYTGLVPTVRSSGESVYRGGITHLGSKPLRHALVEVSLHVCRKSPSLNRLYNRVLYRSNVQKARVAVARKLSVIIYHMLKNSEPYRAETV
ncbi:MAG: IS110 family transposase [candidate division Zixibacteria bacterium]|nr:IS110 family transposase [candidate division Zixibacteria bacterium]MBU1471269.1 IS110 family transposase [candidate division Zixibacteria bacterium]